MPKRIAIIGGGIAGLTAAWQLAQLDPTLDVTLFEATSRLGGTVETIHRESFTIELGPDGWVTEKPWAAELARDLGLADQLTPSNDETRVTWLLRDGVLVPMPDGLRMMVPTNLAALHTSPLFSPAAIRAYEAEPGRAAELRAQAHTHSEDESVASFVERHFGTEVLETIAAPLLSGVFGGDVRNLSVRAVMPTFVDLERTHGSLIVALQSKLGAPGLAPETWVQDVTTSTSARRSTIFTTLRTGTQTLIDRMAAALPPHWLRLNTPIAHLHQDHTSWVPHSSQSHRDEWDHSTTRNLPCDHLILATPAHTTRRLLPALSSYLPQVESSAIIAAYAFREHFPLPQGFGFLVPATEPNPLLAGTFVDQKYPHRAPAGTRLLRAFFGGEAESANDPRSDEQLAQEALSHLEKILGPLPAPAFSIIRRWPRSLPQYAVGHLDRIAAMEAQLPPGLHLLGNPYHGVGLPDLIRDARKLARTLANA